MKVPKGLLRILTPLQRRVCVPCYWSILLCDTMPQLLSIATRLFSLVQKQLAQTLNYSFPLTMPHSTSPARSWSKLFLSFNPTALTCICFQNWTNKTNRHGSLRKRDWTRCNFLMTDFLVQMCSTLLKTKHFQLVVAKVISYHRF